jgi:hypothetical protein
MKPENTALAAILVVVALDLSYRHPDEPPL